MPRRRRSARRSNFWRSSTSVWNSSARSSARRPKGRPEAPFRRRRKRSSTSADTTFFGSTSGKSGTALRYLRWGKDTYANVRPCLHLPGCASPLRDPDGIDFVIVRENLEDLYVGCEGPLSDLAPLELYGRTIGRPVHELGDGKYAIKVITREATERVVRFAFGLARKRRNQLTCATKHNMLRGSDGFFLEVAREVAEDFPDVAFDAFIVDDFACRMIREPKRFDVVVMPNLYGDILSDAAGGLLGSLGLAASGCFGDDYAYFEPAHGTAPDIAGRNIINPTASLLSACMMLEHLGFAREAGRIKDALFRVYADARDSGSPKPADPRPGWHRDDHGILRRRGGRAVTPYREAHPGSGPFLLLVHGFLCSRAQWTPNLEALGRRMPPGGGSNSTVTAARRAREDARAYTPQSYVAALDAIRGELGAASWFRLRRVPRRRIGHPLCADLPGARARSRLHQLHGRLRAHRREPRGGGRALGTAHPRGRHGCDQPHTGASEARPTPAAGNSTMRCWRMRRCCRPEGIANTVRFTTPVASVRGEVANNRVPAMLACGRFERRFQPHREFVAANMPRLAVVDMDAGHAVNMQAAEQFNRAVIDFVSTSVRTFGASICRRIRERGGMRGCQPSDRGHVTHIVDTLIEERATRLMRHPVNLAPDHADAASRPGLPGSRLDGRHHRFDDRCRGVRLHQWTADPGRRGGRRRPDTRAWDRGRHAESSHRRRRWRRRLRRAEAGAAGHRVLRQSGRSYGSRPAWRT